MTEMMVKALAGGDNAEMVLDVLGIPYGGPDRRDSDGEYFSPATKLHEDKYPLPPVVYYHGLTPDGRPAGEPQYIGRAVGYEDRPDGRWYRVVLDAASTLARRVWEAAKQGLARASSGSVAHLVRKAADGHIVEWPVAELSVFDIGPGRQPANSYAVAVPALKAVYEQAGIDLPDVEIGDAVEPEVIQPEASGDAAGMTASGGADDVLVEVETMEVSDMADETDLRAQVEEIVAAKLAQERLAEEERKKAEAEKQAAIEAALKAAREEWEAEAAKARRLPGVPYVAQHADVWKYDNLDAADHAVLVGVLHEARKANRSAGPSEAAIKALGIKLDEAAAKGDIVGVVGQRALKAAGYAGKANELNYSTYATYGDEFVGAAYSQALWESIRQDAWVASWLPSIEVPQGYESITIPVEGGDPTFYKVAQATGLASATDYAPAATITSSKAGTTSQQLTLAKMGARTLYSGELAEDSLIPWANYLRAKLAAAGAETLDAAIIDGDTTATASTNINNIAGTPAGTEYYMLVNGFRKLALGTSGQYRDGGTLDVADFLETLKLLGVAGKNANPGNTMFIVSPRVYWKLLELDEIKTRDVFSQPTLENGQLTGLWGYRLRPSWSYDRASLANTGYEYKENTAGKIDLNTASNNTKGSFLAVNRDQWLLGWRRRMTIEVTRFASSDSNEIVALMRFGLIYRDTSAAAITYNLTV